MVKLSLFLSSILIMTTNAKIRNKHLSKIMNKQSCVCVNYNKCYQFTIDNGGKASDVRISKISCENNLDVCCDIPEGIDLNNKKSKGCGFRNPEGVGFKRLGENVVNEAYLGEFPWMVTVLREETVEGGSKRNKYLCGGSLIHPKVVLTAAHCLSNETKNSLKIRAGEWDTMVKNDFFEDQDRYVKSVIVHPLFHKETCVNDIALVILEDDVKFAEHIDVICLPNHDVIDETRCISSGWGKNAFGGIGKYQAILKKVDLPIVGRNTCQEKLRTTRLGKSFELDRSFICAGGEEGNDMCTGDGSSPLVCPIVGESNRFVQAGIVVWGIGCGDNQIPGVYINVAKFKGWINQEMIRNSLNTSFYQY